jgi:hypothetical protein
MICWSTASLTTSYVQPSAAVVSEAVDRPERGMWSAKRVDGHGLSTIDARRAHRQNRKFQVVSEAVDRPARGKWTAKRVDLSHGPSTMDCSRQRAHRPWTVDKMINKHPEQATKQPSFSGIPAALTQSTLNCGNAGSINMPIARIKSTIHWQNSGFSTLLRFYSKKVETRFANNVELDTFAVPSSGGRILY